MKLLYWDGTGLWILIKRLERGTFTRPKPGDKTNAKLYLKPEALEMLLSGIDLKEKPHLATWYLKIFGKIYRIEATLKEMKADDETKVRYRRRYSLPLLKLIHRANKSLRDRKAARPFGRLGQAISYTLNQWEEVLTYIDHGQVEIDNNGIERDVRPIAIGRKNSLFVGSPEAGDRSALLYSLLISARHHGVDPEAYLRDVIERLPNCGSNEDALEELLPENWAATHKIAQKNLTGLEKEFKKRRSTIKCTAF